MSAFSVTVRTPHAVYQYTAIAASTSAAIDAALDTFGIASVTAKPGVHHG
ncbi:hypothetical protein [Undibacterium curvum]|uniref:Uncharacterized protein n=1 Tax=Undibacterium curvum TaxID=2762294 RepID=A0ABR7A547_9BURK|nr:hypothetical protein [Undibacterium curvum]MBC3932003.1 hypothetical protein [Undibacterium curvum]